MMFRATLIALTLSTTPALAQVQIQEVTSPGGLTAWLVEDHSIPFVALDIEFSGAANLDPEDARGATYMMTAMLEEGAGGLTARDFAAATESLATYFEFDSYRDSIIVTAQMLTQNRDEAADLLRLALIEPSFGEAAIERVRAQILSGIDSDQNDPGEIASEAFYSMAFQGHPYAHQTEGTVESVLALTRDDLVDAHQNALTRDRVFIGAAGDITPDELGILLDTLLDDLPENGTPSPGPANYQLEGGLTVINYPTPQSTALFGHEGIERHDPDFFPAFVLNQILGGSNFRSRLMQEVRVERGLTYGIGTFLSLLDHEPLMLGQFSSSNELVAEAIDVLRAEWADIAENGVSAEELAAAQLYLTGSYPLRFTGNDTLAAIMARMQSDNMPIDYVNTRNDQVMAVTQQDIARTAARLMDPDALHVVVVGEPVGLEDGG